MPYIPHTQDDIDDMLNAVGVDSIDALFDEIPPGLLSEGLTAVPEGRNEMEVTRLMAERAQQSVGLSCFIGAGAYEHHIPAAVWDIASRGELMTAYTPYQAEASQGTLQIIYEYQSMMAHLCAMDVSNASLYDGASALAEALLMAVRANRKSKSKRILMPDNVHPHYRSACHAIVHMQGIEFESIPFDVKTGCIDISVLSQYENDDYCAIVLPFPSFFGTLDDVHAISDWASNNNILVIAVCNPIALSVLVPPGEWGSHGADVVVGEGQPLGVPLASGGPYFGFMCCKQKHVRQMPGRIIGRTVDLDGKTGYALTLQAREQHIRRSKATSNICTNQGWAVSAATMYMSLMGAQGIESVAKSSYENLCFLRKALAQLDGVNFPFEGDHFHECVFTVPVDADALIEWMAAKGVLAGLSLQAYYPQLKSSILVCVTETKTQADMLRYVELLKTGIEEVAAC